MASAREIRRRIKSVKNIQQITKAMKMVAAARLRRAQERASASRPYTDKMLELLTNVASGAGDATHPLLSVRPVKRVGYVIIGADKGLAGAYTSNLIREAVPQVQGRQDIGLITVGRKPRDYFRRRDYQIDREYSGFSEKPSYEHAVQISRDIAADFEDERYDEIHLIYTRFISPVNTKPTTVRLLPLDAPGLEDRKSVV